MDSDLGMNLWLPSRRENHSGGYSFVTGASCMPSICSTMELYYLTPRSYFIIKHIF